MTAWQRRGTVALILLSTGLLAGGLAVVLAPGWSVVGVLIGWSGGSILLRSLARYTKAQQHEDAQ